MEQTLGKRICANRKRLGLTQDQLAEQLGVTAQAVSKWENDISCPDIGMLPKLASVFQISIDTLLGTEPETPAVEGEVVTDTKEDGIHLQKGNWQFTWNAGRISTLAFALTVLITGGQLLVARFLDYELSFWSALWPTALIALGLTTICSKFSFYNLGLIFFGGYFALDNWNLLPFTMGKSMVFPVILVLFGLSLVVDALKRPRKARFKMNHSGNPKNHLQYTQEGFDYSASFGEETQHITLDKLTSGTVSTSFGEFTVDLRGVKEVSKHCSLETNCSFGELTLVVPACFEVKMNNSGAFSDSSITGQPDPNPQGVIFLDNSVSFGEFTLKYI